MLQWIRDMFYYCKYSYLEQMTNCCYGHCILCILVMLTGLNYSCVFSFSVYWTIYTSPNRFWQFIIYFLFSKTEWNCLFLSLIFLFTISLVRLKYFTWTVFWKVGFSTELSNIRAKHQSVHARKKAGRHIWLGPSVEIVFDDATKSN